MIYLVTKQQYLFENEEFELISEYEALDMINSWPTIQFDTETSGRNPHICKVLCAQFGHKDNQIVVDTTTINLTLFKDPLETKLIIGQNLKFDLQFLYNYKIIPRKVYDTMIVDQLLVLGIDSSIISHSLQAIAYRLLNIDIDKSIRSQIIWRGLDTQVIKYAAGDVTYLEDIMQKQLKLCQKKDCLRGAKLECDFVPAIAYLEWCGIKLDVDKWTTKMFSDQNNLNAALNDLNNYVVELYYKDSKFKPFIKIEQQGDLFSGFLTDPQCIINWGSSKQVLEICKCLGFKTTATDKKTGKSKSSVSEKVLKSQKGIDDKFLDLYLKVKEYEKVCSTYGQSYIDAINPITDRIHTTFWQLGARSGRMACGNSKDYDTDLAKIKHISPKKCIKPQIQNLPADELTRSAFVAKEGNYMVSIDFSALESRLGADIYNEPEMLKEFLYGSGDMHSLCAKLVFKKELEGIDVKDVRKLRPDLRHDVKPVEFKLSGLLN